MVVIYCLAHLVEIVLRARSTVCFVRTTTAVFSDYS